MEGENGGKKKHNADFKEMSRQKYKIMTKLY